MNAIQNIDWAGVGVTITTVLTIVIGAIAWLRKNIANMQQLKKDGADLSTQAQYFRAMIKDNAGLRTEISNAKTQTLELTKTFANLMKRKDEEITSLKKDVTDLIVAIKEANYVPK